MINSTAKVAVFSTKLPMDLMHTLDEICRRLGLRKNYVVETALRERLEDLLDSNDLQEAIKNATGFVPWSQVRREIHHRGKR